MREQHLNLLPLVSGLLELRCACQLTCVVAGFFMNAAQDIARWHAGAAARLEFAGMAVALAGAVFTDAIMSIVRARNREVAAVLLESFACGTGILVLPWIEDEVRPAERPIIPLTPGNPAG
jgi:hypothetical protein